MWLSGGGLLLLLLLLLLVLAGWSRAAQARRRRKPAGACPRTVNADDSGAGGVSRWLMRLGAAACLMLAALFYYAWYAFYLKWDFNELGRYYDPVDGVVYTTSGGVWMLPATGLLVVGIVLAWRSCRRGAAKR